MVDVAKVKMFGMPVGTFMWDSNYNAARFEYDGSFIGRGIEPSPIMMPVRRGRVYSFGGLNWDTFNGLPGMLADSLPDTYGRALFDRWLALTGRTSGNPVESLCFLGKRCMGALEFEPATGPSGDADLKTEIDSLVEVARAALADKESFGVNLKDDKKKAIAEILRLGTSAGGQRAKAGFRATENFGRLEYSFFKLAKACGIDMTECFLIEENGRAHFLTRRFDRDGDAKLHMQTLCGIAHYDFRLHRAYSYEQAFGVMRRLKLPYPQAQEMFRRLVFNVVIRNQDDHTKNISFLMDNNGKWRLSPAYDMGYAYNPMGGWTATHQMSVNGKFENITRGDLTECAESNGIRNSDEIIDEVCQEASMWASIAKDCGVPANMIETVSGNMQFI